MVSALDRGVLYGDSLFETVAFANGDALLLDEHLKRLTLGVEKLAFNIDFNILKQEIKMFISKVRAKIDPDDRAVIRITLTRGEHSRGYKPVIDSLATRIISLHEWPQNATTNAFRVALSDVRYSHQPLLAGIKHGNRLEQVLAAQSIPEDADDVIMIDANDTIISCSKGNIFLKVNNEWITPSLTHCGIEGVVRNRIIEYLLQTKTVINVEKITLNDIKNNMLQAAFMCNSIVGIVPISHFSGMPISSEKQCRSIKENLIDQGVIAI
jgi:4-amino-4-deoxychorismate lyase